MKLSEKKCTPCEGGMPPLTEEQSKHLFAHVKNWKLEEKSIKKRFKFKDFAEAMKFVNNVAEIAENEGHHPDIKIHYNHVELELWTHAIGRLSENDFILAAKVGEIKI